MGAITQRNVASSNVQANLVQNNSADSATGGNDLLSKVAAQYGISRSELKHKMLSKGNSLINSAVQAAISNPESLTHCSSSLVATIADKDPVFRSMLRSEFYKAKTAIFNSIENLNANKLLANWGLLERVAPGEFNKESIIKKGICNGDIDEADAKKFITDTLNKYDSDEIQGVNVKDLYKNDINVEHKQYLKENLNTVNNQANLLSKNGEAPVSEKANFFAEKQSSEMTTEQAKKQEYLKQQYINEAVLGKLKSHDSVAENQTAVLTETDKSKNKDSKKETVAKDKNNCKKSLNSDDLIIDLIDNCDNVSKMSAEIAEATDNKVKNEDFESFEDWLTIRAKRII